MADAFWYNKFTVMMCEEVTLRFTYIGGPERMATLERRGGGNNGSDDDDDRGDLMRLQVTWDRTGQQGYQYTKRLFGSMFYIYKTEEKSWH